MNLRVPPGQTPLVPGDPRLAAWAKVAAAAPPGTYDLVGTWSMVAPQVPEEVRYFATDPAASGDSRLLFGIGDYGEPEAVRAALELLVAARSAVPLLVARVAMLEVALAQAIAQRDAAWEPATRRQA